MEPSQRDTRILRFCVLKTEYYLRSILSKPAFAERRRKNCLRVSRMKHKQLLWELNELLRGVSNRGLARLYKFYLRRSRDAVYLAGRIASRRFYTPPIQDLLRAYEVECAHRDVNDFNWSEIEEEPEEEEHNQHQEQQHLQHNLQEGINEENARVIVLHRDSDSPMFQFHAPHTQVPEVLRAEESSEQMNHRAESDVQWIEEWARQEEEGYNTDAATGTIDFNRSSNEPRNVRNTNSPSSGFTSLGHNYFNIAVVQEHRAEQNAEESQVQSDSASIHSGDLWDNASPHFFDPNALPDREDFLVDEVNSSGGELRSAESPDGECE